MPDRVFEDVTATAPAERIQDPVPTPSFKRRSVELPASKYDAASRIVPGLATALVVAAIATVLGQVLPIVGAPVFAIVAGILVAVVKPPSQKLRPGLAFGSKRVLQGAIIVLGTELSFTQVLATGTSSLPVLLGTLAVALFAAWILGKALSIETDLRTLIGVGTAICGASAIVATDAVIGATEVDVSYAIATIFTFNVAAVLTFPTIGHLIGMSAHSFGLWSGTAINDLSSVVAASTVFGKGASSYAVVVKLTRTLMIIPIAVALGIARARAASKDPDVQDAPRLRSRIHRILPIFIVWFVAAVAINSVGLVPAAWHPGISTTATFMITVALASIGLSTRVHDIRRAGFRPLALGAGLWIVVAVASLGLQLLTGTL
ncbi:MAG: putative sulfate exporter family transporter [Actinobacteria bacterium]|nr:putative sulfate exporter family transporter [Actinomycetota bacterium]MCL5444761.1 putative sulfate exporter family transporter [Actinomycetota bacterium]